MNVDTYKEVTSWPLQSRVQ